MLGDITAADEIYIVTGRTDMRKSIGWVWAVGRATSTQGPGEAPLPFLWKTVGGGQSFLGGLGWF